MYNEQMPTLRYIYKTTYFFVNQNWVKIQRLIVEFDPVERLRGQLFLLPSTNFVLYLIMVYLF